MKIYITRSICVVLPENSPTYTLYRYVGYLKKPILTDSTIAEINDYLQALPSDDNTQYTIEDEPHVQD